MLSKLRASAALAVTEAAAANQAVTALPACYGNTQNVS
jgi:hypothetical protein